MRVPENSPKIAIQGLAQWPWAGVRKLQASFQYIGGVVDLLLEAQLGDAHLFTGLILKSIWA